MADATDTAAVELAAKEKKKAMIKKVLIIAVIAVVGYIVWKKFLK